MGIQVWVWVWVRPVQLQCGDLAIFEKIRCGFSGICFLKNYYLYFLYFAEHTFSYNCNYISI